MICKDKGGHLVRNTEKRKIYLIRRPVDTLVRLWSSLQPMVDHRSHCQRTGVPAQEGDVMAAGQTHQTAFGVFLGFLEEDGFFEDVMEVQVEQSDA